MTLSGEVRRKAAAPLAAAVEARRPLPSAAIPISGRQWNRFAIRAAALPRAVPPVDKLVQGAADLGDFVAINAAAHTSADLLNELDNHLWAVAAFTHPGRERAVDAHRLLGAVATNWLRILAGERSEGPWDDAVRLYEALESLAVTNRPSCGSDEDAWTAAFGIPASAIRDRDGHTSQPLLIALFHDRMDQLNNCVRQLLSPFGEPDIGPYRALTVCTGLLDAHDPVETVQVAMKVRDLIASRHAANPGGTIAVLSALLAGVERSWSNTVMIKDTVERISAAQSQGKRAMLQLELYRRITEGQLKGWGWTLVRLLTGVDGAPPMLGQLADQLIASQNDLTDRFAECLSPAARNAAAHEDYTWDPVRRVLTSRGGDIDADQIADLALRGHGLMSGAEIGWALACSDNPAFEAAIQPTGSPDFPTILEVQAALHRFGTNRLEVEAWELEGDQLTVVLRRLPSDRYSPCAQALLEANLVATRVSRFNVVVQAGEVLAMTASRSTLTDMASTWMTARRWYHKMPPAVFLPAFFESRLTVEAPETAAEALTWLALNEAVHFVHDLAETVPTGRLPQPRDVARLVVGLRLTQRALEICADVIPTHREAVLGRAYRAIRGAGTHAAAARPDGDRETFLDAWKALGRMHTKILGMYESIPPPAAMPTVDASPLSG